MAVGHAVKSRNSSERGMQKRFERSFDKFRSPACLWTRSSRYHGGRNYYNVAACNLYASLLLGVPLR